MSANPGTVTINPTTGAVSGSGLARQLYDAEMLGNTLDPDDPSSAPGWENSDPTTFKAMIVGARTTLAAKCQAQANAIAALVGAADVRVPADAFGSGVPSSVVVLPGAVE